jgi:DNA-binding NarL/FixJ family response regulator
MNAAGGDAVLASENLTATGAPGARARVLLAETSPRVRAALRGLLEDEGMQVVAEVDCPWAAVDAAVREAPDVVLLDLRPSGNDSFLATAEIARSAPGTRVIVTTVLPAWAVVSQARQAGAYGVVVKGGRTQTLLSLVTQACADAGRGPSPTNHAVSA